MRLSDLLESKNIWIKKNNKIVKKRKSTAGITLAKKVVVKEDE